MSEASLGAGSEISANEGGSYLARVQLRVSHGMGGAYEGRWGGERDKDLGLQKLAAKDLLRVKQIPGARASESAATRPRGSNALVPTF